MFNWWMARSAEGGSEDTNDDAEPPETPAPVFAARAIKSAIFGTPAPPDDETMLEIEEEEQREDAARKRNKQHLRSGSVSPTKPAGILLTPGTATARRKTVSFENEGLGKTEKNASDRLTTKDAAAKGVRSEESVSGEAPVARSSLLKKALEDAREERAGRVGEEKSRGRSDSQPASNGPSIKPIEVRTKRPERAVARAGKVEKSNQEVMQELETGDALDADMTVDLNEPHSQSGRYWKAEFEQYHHDARVEMTKLTKYKHLAKSYARKKDAEARDLAAKLKEEQRRVLSMEERLSRLSVEIAKGGLEGQEDHTPALIKELARQTALAVQYRAQVEEFRAALEGDDGKPELQSDDEREISPRKAQSVRNLQRELKKVKEQLRERDAVQDGLRDLKKRLSAAEENTKKLQDENTRLTQELLHADLRLENETEKAEKRRQSYQERLRKKEEALQALQKDYDSLKESSKSQRREADHFSKKRQDQIGDLKKELASYKGAESTVKDLQKALQDKTTEHVKVTSDYQRRIERLISTQTENSQAVTLPTKATLTHASQPSRPKTADSEFSQLRESHIPVMNHSITRPLKTLAAGKISPSEEFNGSHRLRSRSSHSALSDITSGSNSERLPPPQAPVQMTPLAHRFSDLSLDAPSMQMPSPEPSILYHGPGRGIHERNCRPSPRPSMFVLPSSPPKQAVPQPRTSTEIARQRSITTAANAASRISHLETSRVRTALPPERAAAAKARLEQKHAEKKRAQAKDSNKENVRG